MPATTPVATGSSATPRARSDAKAASSSTLTTTVPALASQCTSRSMRARLSTLNTGAPLSCSTKPCACSGARRPGARWRWRPSGRRGRRRRRGWWPSAAHAACRRVRGRATHTPSSLRGARAGISDSAMRCVSPLGSRGSSGLMASPAGVPSSDMASAMALRRPSGVKRSGVTAGLSSVAVLEQPLTQAGPAVGVAVVDLVEAAAVAQRLGQRARGLGAARGITAGDAHQQRARRQPAVDLLDQQLLARIGRGRQEGAEVGRERRAHDQRQRQPPAAAPTPPARRARRGGGAAAGVAIIGPASPVPAASASGRRRPAARRCCARRRPGPPPRSAAAGAAAGLPAASAAAPTGRRCR
jgi:hypothetical protein